MLLWAAKQRFSVTLIWAVPQRWTDLFVHLYGFENTLGFEGLKIVLYSLDSPFRSQQRDDDLLLQARRDLACGSKELPVFIWHYCSGQYLWRLPDGKVIGSLGKRALGGYRMGAKRRRVVLPTSIPCPFCECQTHTQQSSQTPVWLALKAPAKRGPKRKWERKTSLVSGILLIIFHNLADNGWQCHCHPGPAAKDTRCSFPLRHPVLPAFDRGRCEVGRKIKSSFRMCSGFFKYKLIFTCESASLLVPLSLASSRSASSLSLTFKHLRGEVLRTWILNILFSLGRGKGEMTTGKVLEMSLSYLNVSFDAVDIFGCSLWTPHGKLLKNISFGNSSVSCGGWRVTCFCVGFFLDCSLITSCFKFLLLLTFTWKEGICLCWFRLLAFFLLLFMLYQLDFHASRSNDKTFTGKVLCTHMLEILFGW